MSDDDGKLSKPTAAERATTLELARAIIAAEQNDEEWPRVLCNPLLTGARECDRTEVFRLAQDLVDTRRALDEAIATAYEIEDWTAPSSDEAIRFIGQLTDKLERLERVDLSDEERDRG